MDKVKLPQVVGRGGEANDEPRSKGKLVGVQELWDTYEKYPNDSEIVAAMKAQRDLTASEKDAEVERLLLELKRADKNYTSLKNTFDDRLKARADTKDAEFTKKCETCQAAFLSTKEKEIKHVRAECQERNGGMFAGCPWKQYSNGDIGIRLDKKTFNEIFQEQALEEGVK